MQWHRALGKDCMHRPHIFTKYSYVVQMLLIMWSQKMQLRMHDSSFLPLQSLNFQGLKLLWISWLLKYPRKFYPLKLANYICSYMHTHRGLSTIFISKITFLGRFSKHENFSPEERRLYALFCYNRCVYVCPIRLHAEFW